MEHIQNDKTEETFKDFESLSAIPDSEIYDMDQESHGKGTQGSAKFTRENCSNVLVGNRERSCKMVTMETFGSNNYTSDLVDLQRDNVNNSHDNDVTIKEELDTTDFKSPVQRSTDTDLGESIKSVISAESITGGVTFKCKLCSKFYKCRKSAEYHVKIKHKSYSLFCQVCGKSFKLKYDLDRHLNVHNGIRPYPCPECDKSFVCRSSQMRHRKFHHLVGDIYKCHNCDKTFRAESDLKRHLLTHTGERPWTCDKCPKSFVSKSSLKVHEKSHDDSQKFSCAVCKKMFHIKTDLTRHESTHTGDLKWECAICQKKYSGKSAVKRHVKDAHIFGKVKYHRDEMKIEDLLESISENYGDLKEFEAFAKYKEDNSVENLLKAVDSFVIYRGDNKDTKTE